MQAIMNKKLKFFKNQKGLTLIELLAVIVILGIIAAIAVPSIVGVMSKSRLQADHSSYLMIKDAALRYAMVEAITTDTNRTLEQLKTDGYLNDVPKVQSDKMRSFDSVEIEVSGNNYVVKVYGTDSNNNANTEITDNTFK